MSLSTTTATAVAFLAFTAVASFPAEPRGARAEIVRVGPGRYRSVTKVQELRVEEAVTLDADDHLVSAYVRVEQPGHLPASMWLDRGASTVTVAQGTEVARLAAPTDAPWGYEPAVATALGAWVIARAAASGAPVRVVHPDRSELVPADQLLVATDDGAVAVVGDDAVRLDARFVESVELRARATTLSRTEASADRWVLTDAADDRYFF